MSSSPSHQGADSRPPRNTAARVGLVLALVSIPLIQFGLVALVAAAVSAVGVVRARRLGGEGRVRAWVGVGLGLVVAVAAILRYRWVTG